MKKPIRPPARKLAAPSPVLPHPWEPADAKAFQQLAKGEANPDQQRRALDWLIAAAGTYDLSYRPDSDRDTAFAEGKRSLGLQVVKLLTVNVSRILNKENEHHDG